MKKITMRVLLVALILTISLVGVKAASQVWGTYLDISAGSKLVGRERDHFYENQRIAYNWTEIGQTFNETPYMHVQLYKKGFLGLVNNLVQEQDLKVGLTDIYTDTTYYATGKGTYYFVFSTGTATHPTGYFHADPVYISSFDQE